MGHRQRGDTLVEVLLSIVILSMVIVGAMTLMSRGLAAVQVALEHTEVRMHINGQIELLRYLREQYATDNTTTNATVWRDIVTGSNTNAAVYDETCGVTPSKNGTAFYLTAASDQVQRTAFDPSVQPDTSAEPGQGLWIEATPSSGAPLISPAYVDFVIRACWQASGSLGQQRTVTAVRLYDPSR